jgi:hypothetical protein
MSDNLTVDVFKKAYKDPEFEARYVSRRPLRGPQAEIIRRVEKFVAAHQGGIMTIRSARQTGKNETAANLQKRHLFRRQFSNHIASWIRTAPTYAPQIVNSKKRLQELLRLDSKNVCYHPLFLNEKLQKSEGYIWRYGNATVEFLSSGPQSNVVGATASECLDMDEAHKIDFNKFSEDFMPFTASTNAATLLWGVAADGLDTIQTCFDKNIELGRPELNLHYPCEIWMEDSPIYAAHVQSRIDALGWEHPILKTQYRLIPVSHEGTFINATQALSLFNSEHERQLAPIPGRRYEILIDVAGGNEEMNPDQLLIGEEETATDSTVVWIYEITDQIASNNLFPVIHLVNLYWWTGVDLPKQQDNIEKIIKAWKPSKVTVDSVGIGRQIGEGLRNTFGEFLVNAYVASNSTVSDDCFDLLARLNFDAVKMFRDDGSSEYQEFKRQVGWTRYASSQGKMKLIKPKADKHIDMVKATTYIAQNNPVAGIQTIIKSETDYE